MTPGQNYSAESRLDRILADMAKLDGMGRAAFTSSGHEILQRLVSDVASLSPGAGSPDDVGSDLEHCRQLLENTVREAPGRTSRVCLAQCRDKLAGVVRQSLRDQAARPESNSPDLFDRMVWLIPSLVVAGIVLTYLSSALTTTFNEVQVYWRSDAQKFSEPKSQRSCATMDGQWRTYEFRLVGRGVAGLRIDPVGNGVLASRVRIRNLQYQGISGGRWEDIPLTAGDCDSCQVRPGLEYMEITPEGADPWLEFPSFTPRDIAAVRFEAGIDAARLWPWTWLSAWFSEVEANCGAGLPPHPLPR